MRCPKCHYLSFDPEPRCKNCGYDLEVAEPDLVLHGAPRASARATAAAQTQGTGGIDLKLRETPSATAVAERFTVVPDAEDVSVDDVPEIQLREPEVPNDLVLELVDEGETDDAVAKPAPTPTASTMIARTVEPLSAPVPAPAPAPAPRRAPALVPPPAAQPAKPRAPHTTTEMPLFVKRMSDHDRELPDEELLIRQFPSVPPSRPPLGVRRAAPEAPRAAATPPEPRLGPLDHDLLEDLRRVERDEAAQARADARAITDTLSQMEPEAEPVQRLAAAAIDTAILGGIAAFVFWATLRLLDVTLTDLGMASLVPLLAFLVLMDIGYLLMFTAAGGQTVGKMMMGLRVITDDGPSYVTVRQAAWRAVLTVAGLGLGWLPALSAKGAALHDRLAHTRVVRA
jgi:uncharacterized RDD family membrane protein YckC